MDSKPGPSGWLIKDYADGWYWTGSGREATLALEQGQLAYCLESKTYEERQKVEFDTMPSVSDEDMRRIKEGLKDLVDGRISAITVQEPPHPTLHDQLAMAALTGLVSSMQSGERGETLNGVRGGASISKASYMYADAMLAAREAG